MAWDGDDCFANGELFAKYMRPAVDAAQGDKLIEREDSMAYEYQYVPAWSRLPGKIRSVADMLGQQGWRLVEMITVPVTTLEGPDLLLVFEREKPTGPRIGPSEVKGDH